MNMADTILGDDHPTEGLSLMVVVAHPDDEAAYTGGILARAASEGIRTTIVMATASETGNDPSVAHLTDKERGERRIAELREVCKVLDVSNLEYLGYINSQFHRQDPQAVIGVLVGLLRRYRPTVVVTTDPILGGSGHVEHLFTGLCTTAAFFMAGNPCYPEQSAAGLLPYQPRKLYYIALPESLAAKWGQMCYGGLPDQAITTEVDVTAWADRKERAIRCYRSTQHDVDQIMNSELRATLTTEFYVRAVPVAMPTEMHQIRHGLLGGPGSEHESDLFAGLR
jgi:N-acetyl-1-D-myo-inositol-2-amino-2-deoxy-alpha-D-glucopyranoside deacetylase